MFNFVGVICLLGAVTLVTSVNQTSSNATINGTSLHDNSANKDNNTSTNGSSNDALHYISILACLTIMVLGFFGNLLVILIFVKKWNLLKTCEVLMVNLAVADLIGTFTVPLERLRDLFQLHDQGSGDFLGCQLPTWLASTSMSVSSVTLVAIALDRFIVVARPLLLRQGPSKLIYCVMAFIWVIGSSSGLPHFVYTIQSYHNDFGYYCSITLDPEEDRNFTLVIFFVSLVIPVLSMSVVYSFIVFKLRSGSLAVRRLSETDNVVRIRTVRQKRATKLFIVVVIIFTALVLPYNLFMVLLKYGHIPPTPRNRRIYDILILIMASNSCVNPLIYSRLHKSFRKSTLSLLFGCCVQRYYRYEWESRFISRSSFHKRRRGTDQSNTRNTMTSMRKSPVPDDLATQVLSTSTPPRTLSAVSSRSSRLSSAGSDDVFLRKASERISAKNEENAKLQKIPETISSVSGCSSDDVTPESAKGKYVQLMDSCNVVCDTQIKANGVTASDIKLHSVSVPDGANGTMVESNFAVGSKFVNNGYSSLNGTPCSNGKSFLKDTQF